MAGSKAFDGESPSPKEFVRRIPSGAPVPRASDLWGKAVEAGRAWEDQLSQDDAVVDDEKHPEYRRIRFEKFDELQPVEWRDLAREAHAGHEAVGNETYLGAPLDVRGSIYLEAAALAIEGALDFLAVELREGGGAESFRFKAVSQVIRRACETAREIAVLIRSGLPIGAWGRWRVMFECRVIARVLATGDEDVAEAFLLQCRVNETRVLTSTKGKKGQKKAVGALEAIGYDPSGEYRSTLQHLVGEAESDQDEAHEALQQLDFGVRDGDAAPGGPRPLYLKGQNPNAIDRLEWARGLVAGDELRRKGKTQLWDSGRPATVPGKPKENVKFDDLVEYLRSVEKADPSQHDEALRPIRLKSKEALRGFNLFNESGVNLFYQVGNEASHAYFVREGRDGKEELVIVAPTYPLFPGLLACEDLLTLTAVIQQVVHDLPPQSQPSEDARATLVNGMLGISLSLIANGHRHFVDEVKRVFPGLSYRGPNPWPTNLGGGLEEPQEPGT